MPKTVALIDSQQSTRRMLHFAMKVQGYRVVEIDDAAGMHDALAGKSRDLLIVGINDGESGRRELIDGIRRQPVFDGLPILLVGENRLRPGWDVRAIGSCAWLDKPFRAHEVQAMVECLLVSVALPKSRQGSVPERARYA